MDTMKRIAKRLDLLCLILICLTIISTAAVPVSHWFMAETEPLDGITVMGGITWEGPVRAAPLMAASILIAVVSGLFLIAGLQLVRNILKPMKQGMPFTGVVTKNLRRLGFLVLAAAVLDVFYELWGKNMLARLVTGPEGGGSLAVTHQVNFMLFVMAALLFLLSYVFRYGEELQKLSDETL